MESTLYPDEPLVSSPATMDPPIRWDQTETEMDSDEIMWLLLTNLSQKTVESDWPELTHILYWMPDDQFRDLSLDVSEELIRRENQLRDGVFSLPDRQDHRMGRNKTRQGLSRLTDARFDSLCITLRHEIAKRYTSTCSILSEAKTSISSSESFFNGKQKKSLGQPVTGLDDFHECISDEIPVKRLRMTLHQSAVVETETQNISFDLLCKWDASFELLLATVSLIFVNVLKDRKKRACLMGYRGDTAQQILDLLQMLVDYPFLDKRLKSILLRALFVLSEKSALHPRCYTLKDVEYKSSPIASGHFGEILKGRVSGQSVSLKVLKMYQRSRVDRLLKKFCKEAIVWGHLSHPNLLPFYGIYHLDDAHGRPCLVSPWMENGNICEYLSYNVGTCRILLVSDIANGVKYLHENKIVHGDLKGANILITASGRACLADFGLSTVLDDELHHTLDESTSSVGGTIRWLAPELLDPEHDDAQSTRSSDIYALSCVCYEVFTGEYPFFEIPRDTTVILAVMRGERPSNPSSNSAAYLHWGLSEPMWKLMQECWESEPSQRPTATDVVSRLPLGCIRDRRSDTVEDVPSPSYFRKAMHETDYISDSVLEIVLSWL